MAEPVIGETFKCTLPHLERELSYLVHFRTSVANLNVHVQLLRSKRDDASQLIRQATMNDEVTLKTVESWLSTVEDVLGRATSLDEKASEINQWFKGWFCSRFLLGRRAQKEILIVQWLLEKVDAFGERVSYQRPVQDLITGSLGDVNAIEGRVLDETTVEDLASRAELMAFGVRVTTAMQVIQALRNDATSLLGVYGMPGVGKTTLISAVAIYVKEKKIFDEVVVVTLTQTPEIKLIQGDIASGLDLKLQDEDSLTTRALRLSRRLSQDRKTLIVLDNLWQEVKLVEVGIPEGLENCKVVFTTRDADVCNSMDTGDSRIRVEVLSPEESWDLFRKKAGDTVDSPAFQTVARDVLNECQGLPLLIAALGKALYRKDKTYWDAALESLRSSTLLPNPIFTGMPQVFSGMKLSYDYLQSEATKICFLVCCLFPDGYHISMDQLFHYMTGERILTTESTLQEARLHLHVIVDKLISSCLLLQAKSGCIFMHDVVRDVALAIASDPREGNGFIVKAGVQLNGWPNMQLADCKRLSFITTRGNHMSWSLPNQIRAVHLLTLSFHGNERLVNIPAGFFEETPNLLTVDLSYTGIKVLPQAIMSLGKLHTLLLEGCFCLNTIYLSNTMERLEILSLRYSAIESVTMSRKMTTLKLLDLSYTSKLEHIGQNIISSLIQLEELYLFESFRAWEPEKIELGESSGRVSKGKNRAEEDVPEGPGVSSSKGKRRGDSARLSEVTSLPRLTSLELHVGNLECLFQSFPNWENLKRFKIAVGVIDDFSPFGIDDGLQMEKSMYIELGSRVVANWVKVLLGRTNFLQLKGSRRLIDLFQRDASPEPQMFCDLKVLILSRIESQILSDPSPVQRVFSAVKKVLATSDIIRVPGLIPCDFLVRLQNLNKLVVMNCKYLQKLVELGEEDQAVSMGASSSLKSNTVKFYKMPASSVFPKLTYLRICKCDSLMFLFPMRVIRDLSLLEKLYVSHCHKMERVIVHEDATVDGDADGDKFIFPKLQILSLECLSKLSHIIQQDIHVEWPALEELTVKYCSSLIKLPLGPDCVPKLTKFLVNDDSGTVFMREMEERSVMRERDEQNVNNRDIFDMLEWDDENVKNRLIRLVNRLLLNGRKDLRELEQLDPLHSVLRILKVIDYNGASLVSCNLLRRLFHLDSLVVRSAQNLEKMIKFGRKSKAGEDIVGDTSAASSSLSSVIESKFSKFPASLVFPNLTRLEVFDCNKLKYLLPMRAARDMLQLKDLEVSRCNAMESIIEYDNYSCVDEVKTVFSNLTRLRVSSCNTLGYLLPMRVVRNMVQLKSLSVSDCKSAETIIGHQAEDGGDVEKDKATLPKLEILNIHRLPHLSRFVRKDTLFDWPSLESLTVKDCLCLKKLPLGPGSVPNLKDFWLPILLFDGLEWEDDDQNVKSRLLSLLSSIENQLPKVRRSRFQPEKSNPLG